MAGGLFGGSDSVASTIKDYTNVSVQTSSAGLVIPVGWGQCRGAPNAIWLNGFQKHSGGGGKGGKGGGGKGGQSQTTYTTACILACVEGPMEPTESIRRVWKNGDETSLAALDLTAYTGTDVQTPPGYITTNYPGEARSYAFTGYVFSPMLDLGSTNTLPQLNFEYLLQYHGSVDPALGDAPMDYVVRDFLLNPRYGLDPYFEPYVDDDSLHNVYGVYLKAAQIWMSPLLSTQEQALTIMQRWAQLTNSWFVWTGVKLKFIPLADSPVSSPYGSYTPDLTPIYDLTYDDFVFDPESEDPVTFRRTDPKDIQSRYELDTLDRNNSYNTNPVTWEEQSLTDAYGLQTPQVIQATEICEPYVAQTVIQLIGRRNTAGWNTFSFKLGPNFFLLEPGDYVTLTDPNLELVRSLVRITGFSEDDTGVLSFEAEEMLLGSGSAALYNIQVNSASPPPDLLADPGDVNPPAIFEPSPVYTNGQAQLWIGLSGGSEWGGADVFISADGTNYANMGTITTKIPQGVLTADLPSHVDPDTVNTLSVDLTESGMPLAVSTTHADADNFTTSCLIGTEIIAYGDAVLTGSATYDLDYLRRGVYNTTPAAHTTGDQFSRLDPSAMLILPLPQQWVGVTLYFKFTSFNSFGNMHQDISGVTVYTYTPTGPAFNIAPPTAPVLTAIDVVQPDGTAIITMNLAWAASPGPQLASYEVQFSLNSGSTWTVDRVVGADTLSFALAPAVANTNYQARVRAISQNGMATSTWATSTVVNSGDIITTVPGTPTGLTATGGVTLVALSWNANPATDAVQYYKLYRATGPSGAFGSAVLIATVSALNYSDVGLAAGTVWTYFLVATNAAGDSGHTTGVDATVLSGQNRWAPSFSLARKTTASELILEIAIVYPVSLPINLTGSEGGADIAGTGSTVFTLNKNGASIGTMTIPSATTGRGIATFSFASAVSFAAGDSLSLTAPASPDATLSNFYATFLGSK